MTPFDEDPADNRSELDLCIDEIKQLQVENEKLKTAYAEIFETYIPAAKMDEANNKLILLLEGQKEEIGRDLLEGEK